MDVCRYPAAGRVPDGAFVVRGGAVVAVPRQAAPAGKKLYAARAVRAGRCLPGPALHGFVSAAGQCDGLDDVLAESVIILTLLAGTVFVPAAALGLGVASVLAAVVHLRRTPAAETRAYREGPLALALVLCVGVAALCVCFFLYLTI